MSNNHQKPVDPATTLRRVRERILGGSRILLDTLTTNELAAAHTLIFSEEAEIVSEACKPFLVAKLDRFIIS